MPESSPTSMSAPTPAAGGSTAPDPPHVSPTLDNPAAADSAPPVLLGYVVGGQIGRGGMGRVYAGRELALGREVAIKTLLPGANPERFVTESTLTARLAHPGIPPVYALGTTTDGRPFLAMKLIRGRTLAELLHARTSPADDLPRFVQTFEQVAQAVAFAHTHGVIHRDLKPGNVMVGEFGEVQVMDWGLAREVAAVEPTAASPEPAPPTAAGDTPLTSSGTVLGTPGYMPPEQARGEAVGPAADVFALGSVLTEILTGRPAFTGETTWEVVFRTTTGDLADALERLDRCGADPELVALAVKYLTENAGRRPPTAGAVAGEVAAYQAGVEHRLRRAESDARESAVRDGERRKRQRVLIGSAGAVAAVLVLGVIGTTVGMFKAEAAAGAEKSARTDVERKKAEVEGALAVAADRTRLAMSAFDEVVHQIDTRLADLPNQQAVRRVLLNHARDGLRKILDDARKLGRPDESLMRIHTRLGDVSASLLDWAEAERNFRQAIAAAEQLNAGGVDPVSPDESATLHNRLGDCCIQQRRPADALEAFERATRFRQELLRREPHSPQARRNLAVMYGRLGDVSLLTGDTEQARGHLTRCRKELDELVASDPRNPEYRRNLCTCLMRLGAIELTAGEYDPATPYLTEAKANAIFLTIGHPKSALHFLLLSECNLKLAQAEEGRGRLSAAGDLYRQARQAAESLLSKGANDVAGRLSLVEARLQEYRVAVLLGREGESAAHLKAGRAVSERLRAELTANPDPLVRLGTWLTDAGAFALQREHFATAETLLHDSLVTRERAQPDDWTTHNTQSLLGSALLGQKRYTDAEPLLIKGFEGMRAREKAIPAAVRAERMTAALDDLVKLFEATGKPDEAKKYRGLRAEYPAAGGKPTR